MTVKIINADVLDGISGLADESVQCVVTSPPYWGLRDYGVDGQIGLEDTPEAFVARLVDVFRDVRRVLKPEGTCWVNLGDSYARNPNKGGSGPGGKNEERFGYGEANFKRGKIKSEQGKGGRLFSGLGSEAGIKEKDLVGIPWMFAFAARADGWYLRRDIIWSKPNPMPESVQDRCTSAHEYIFMLTKSAKYYYDAEAIREKATWGKPNAPDKIKSPHGQGFTRKADKERGHGRRHDGFNDRWDGMTKAEQQALGRNKRSVWTVATKPFSEAHFATFPPELIEPMIKAGCPKGGVVLDPFGGSGTTGLVADRLQRDAILIELNPEYVEIADRRINSDRGGLLDAMEAA